MGDPSPMDRGLFPISYYLFGGEDLEGAGTAAGAGEVGETVGGAQASALHDFVDCLGGEVGHVVGDLGIVECRHAVAEGEPTLHVAVVADGEGRVVATEGGYVAGGCVRGRRR